VSAASSQDFHTLPGSSTERGSSVVPYGVLLCHVHLQRYRSLAGKWPLSLTMTEKTYPTKVDYPATLCTNFTEISYSSNHSKSRAARLNL